MSNFQTYVLFTVINEMLKNWKRCPSQFLRAQGDISKLLLSDQQPKTKDIQCIYDKEK